MPAIEFDELVRGLQRSVARAQTSLLRANRGRLERLVELDRDGRSEALTWSFVMDEEAGDGHGARTLRLPLLTMRPHLTAQVDEVRLDLQAKVKLRPELRRSPLPRRLRLVLRRRTNLIRRRLHTLTIRLQGAPAGAGDILVDGHLLKTLDAQPDGAAEPR